MTQLRSAWRNNLRSGLLANLSFASKIPVRTHSFPLLTHDTESAWKNGQVMEATVLVNPSDPTELLMYYCGQNTGGVVGQVARATADASNVFAWTPTHDNVLTVGGAAAWDESMIRLDTILYNEDDSTYYLYYTGRNASFRDKIGLATSADGITFTKHASNPIMLPNSPETDVNQAAVLRVGSTWYMYYSHRDGAAVLQSIKLATPTDGISWTYTGTSVWDVGTSGAYDDTYVEFHSITKVGLTYYMVVECYDGATWSIGLGYSSAPDAVFTKLETPIFQASGVTKAFDEFHVATPTLFGLNDRWYLFYCGANQAAPYTTADWEIGVAEFIPSHPAWADIDWSQWFDHFWVAIHQDDQAASYVDQVGALDLTTAAAPSWSTEYGWSFNGSSQYLDTGLAGNNSYSAMVRFIAATKASQNAAMFGETTTTANATRLCIYPWYAGPRAYFRSGGNYDQATVYHGGDILAVTPSKAYAGGQPIGSMSGAWTGSTSNTIVLGGHRINGTVSEFWLGRVQAFGIKKAELSDAQIAAAWAAMASI